MYVKHTSIKKCLHKNRIEFFFIFDRKKKKQNAGESAEKREPSNTVGGNVNWYNHYGKQYGSSLKNKHRTTI